MISFFFSLKIEIKIEILSASMAIKCVFYVNISFFFRLHVIVVIFDCIDIRNIITLYSLKSIRMSFHRIKAIKICANMPSSPVNTTVSSING